MARRDRILINHLFVAAPELLLEEAFVRYLLDKGYIDKEGLAFIEAVRGNKKRFDRIRRRVSGKPLFHRLLAIAPEILNLDTIEILYRTKKINKADYFALRLLMRYRKAGGTALPTSLEDALKRVSRLFGVTYSEDTLGLLLEAGLIDRREHDRLRQSILLSKLGIRTIGGTLRAKSILEALMLIGSGMVDRHAINTIRQAGLIDSRTANSLLTALSYGKAEWTIFEGSKRAEGLAARMAYMISGSFSFEMLEFLKAMKKLTPEQALIMQVAVSMSQRYNRQLMEQMTDRRFRVVPGELPIVSFARASKQTNDDLLSLLAEAAAESRREAERLVRKGGAGRAVRAAEYAVNARALHQSMRRLWEGVGFLTIFGEREVADAAISAAEFLESKYTKHIPPMTRMMLERQSRAGLDSYISRKENTFALSRRVYGNYNLWTNKVDRQISLGLLEGQSAQEIANRVRGLIDPKVMGGVKYAAMRLGRTELANAFHFTTIRHTREQPWVRGYRWNRSRSHRHSDVCDEYANDDHDNLGPGVFKKANVPDKPHPQCMCYVTVVGMNEDDWVKAYKAGRFNSYFATRVHDPSARELLTQTAVSRAAGVAGHVAGQVALSQAATLAVKMMEGGVNKPGINFRRWRDALDGAIHADVTDLQTAYLDPDDPSAWGGVGEEAAKIAALKKAIPGEENLLIDRQVKFNSLTAIENEFNRLNPQFRSSIGDELDPFAPERYYTLFGDKEGSLNLEGSGQLLERPAKHLYGMTAYRTLNAKLRNARGNLNLYDQQFYEGEEFFNGFRDAIKAIEKNDPEAYENFTQHLLDFQAADHRIHANALARKNKVFGFRIEDVESYYSELGVMGLDPITGDVNYDLWDGMRTAKNHSDFIRVLDASMMPTKHDAFLTRVAGSNWLGPNFANRLPTRADVGYVFKDGSFTSTEGIPYYFNEWSEELDLGPRSLKFKIFAPQGTMATRFNASEYEIGLSRGTKFQILDVIDIPESEGSSFFQEIHLSIIDQDDVWNGAREYFSSKDKDDMWDSILGEF